MTCQSWVTHLQNIQYSPKISTDMIQKYHHKFVTDLATYLPFYESSQAFAKNLSSKTISYLEIQNKKFGFSNWVLSPANFKKFLINQSQIHRFFKKSRRRKYPKKSVLKHKQSLEELQGSLENILKRIVKGLFQVIV